MGLLLELDALHIAGECCAAGQKCFTLFTGAGDAIADALQLSGQPVQFCPPALHSKRQDEAFLLKKGGDDHLLALRYAAGPSAGAVASRRCSAALDRIGTEDP